MDIKDLELNKEMTVEEQAAVHGGLTLLHDANASAAQNSADSWYNNKTAYTWSDLCRDLL